MIDFIIKSGVSMAVLLAIYHLLLEKEKMHVFNRFYLIASLVFSIALPFITITIYTEVASIPAILTANNISATGIPTAIESVPGINYTPYIMWGLYSVISSFMLLRFIKNVHFFTNQICANKVVAYKSSKLVLVDADILPHTFLNYIFLNRKSYEDRTIEDELYSHELVHVNQWHTLDILFIEALKVILWFNPLLYLYKKAVQLNHEFIADENVIAATKNVVSYQQLLLDKSSPSSYYHLASSLNFSITKKRFTMMTKKTSRRKEIFKQLCMAPLFTAIFLISCTKTQQKESLTDDVNKDAKYMNTEDVPNLVYEKYLDKMQETDSVYSHVAITEMPQFPGGIKAFYKFIAQNLKVPPELNGKAKLYVSFVVEKDGTVSNLKILRDPTGGSAGIEIFRVLESAPKWLPGKQDGKAVRTGYTLPITIMSKA